MVILSASRRTDMPAFYPEEIMRHVKSHLELDGLVLWTKNPLPFFPFIDGLKDLNVPFYFQYTLNDYGALEPGIPSLDVRLNTFKVLSELVGKERVIWRFDPIMLTKDIDIEDISTKFKNIAKNLHMHTERVVFSFVDMYPKIEGNGIIPPNDKEMEFIEREILDTCKKYGLTCATCSETFQIVGIEHNQCIDVGLLNRISGNNLAYTHDCTQRRLCGCAKSVDIGQYHTCKHGCIYCYAC